MLVLISFFIGPTPLTLVLSPLLVVALVGLYSIITAAFWWG